MTSILVSSNDKTITTDIAKQLAEKLDYTHLGEQFLEDVAQKYNTTDEKLQKALNWLISAKLLSNKSIDLHLAYIQEAVLERFLTDNVVCEGLGAHLYIKDISHILNVRILTENSDLKNNRLDDKSGYLKNFRKIIDKTNFIRTGSSNNIFIYDENDSSFYDIALNLEKIGLENIVDTITTMAKNRKFKPMTYSRKMLKDLILASKLRVLLLPRFIDFQVETKDGTAIVTIKCTKRQKAKIAGEIKVIANAIPDIKFVEVHAVLKLSPLFKNSTT